MDKHENFKLISKNKIQARHDLTFTPLMSSASAGAVRVSQGVDDSSQGAGMPPNPEDYVQRDFRLLSAVTIRGAWVPIDYSRPGVLEEATPLFRRSLFTDHWSFAELCIGSVRFPRFNDTSTPPGVDGTFFVLQKTNDTRKQDISKLVADGHLDRCSVTILFEWEQSHPDMKEKEFWLRIGETDDDGELIRVVVTKVIDILEISIVYFGADNTAGNSELDEVQYQSVTGRQRHALNSQSINNKEVQTKMEEKFQGIKERLEAHLGRVFKTGIEVVQALDDILASMAALKTEKTALEAKVTELAAAEKFKNDVVSKLRQDVTGLAAVFSKTGKLDAHEQAVYEAASFEKLVELKSALENKIGLKCQKCGSTDVSRRSSVETPLKHAADIPASPGEPAKSYPTRLKRMA